MCLIRNNVPGGVSPLCTCTDSLSQQLSSMTVAWDIPDKNIVEDPTSFLSLSSSSSASSSGSDRSVKRRKKKKKKCCSRAENCFSDVYRLKGEFLGEGSYGCVETCINIFTGVEFAVKIIEKTPRLFNRSKILKEIENYHLCSGQQNIIQLVEFFEETNYFYLVFEKILGGSLFDHIQRRVVFTEAEASRVVKDLAQALKHLHARGVAHRDLKPDNVLCVDTNCPCPVKLCDFDLCSDPVNIDMCSTPTLLSPVGSLDFMAPEVVDIFMEEDDDKYGSHPYNKKCDLWSLGVIMYILLCGYAPFSGHCGSDCGWDRGESCPDCQERLFTSIKEGNLVFHEKNWADISPAARNLIQGLLVTDSEARLDANQVLRHPWIVDEGNSNSLKTPLNLRRQTSLKDLEDFASRAMAVNRVVEQSTTHTTNIKVSSKINNFTCDFSPSSVSSCDLMDKLYDIKEQENESLIGVT